MITLVLASIAMGAALAAQPTNPPPKPEEKPAKPQTPPATAPAQTAPQTTPPNPPADKSAVPSLDEALGIAKPTQPQPLKEKGAAVPSDLDRALKGEDAGNELQRAVALMGESAKRLEGDKDTSLSTQRMQEETVRLLDAVVKKSNQKKNSQSKQQQQQQQQNQQQQQQPNQSQQSQNNQEKDNGQTTGGEVLHGGNTNAQLRPGIDAARAAWGNLPQRVRQLLVQGSGDQFSKEYQRLTEEYYKRLGEGAGGPSGAGSGR